MVLVPPTPEFTHPGTPLHGLEQSFLPQAQSVTDGFDYDLAIVGGGIAGATLACALKNSGLTVALIEAQPYSKAVAQGQAYNISLMSSQIYQGIGVWSKIVPKVTPYQQIQLSDADFPQVVHFRPKDLQTQDLGYVAEHGVLLQALQDFCRTVRMSSGFVQLGWRR